MFVVLVKLNAVNLERASSARASRFCARASRAARKRTSTSFLGSHEREGKLHGDSPARWWALARKHEELHAEDAARPSSQGHKRPLTIATCVGRLMHLLGTLLFLVVTRINEMCLGLGRATT